MCRSAVACAYKHASVYKYMCTSTLPVHMYVCECRTTLAELWDVSQDPAYLEQLGRSLAEIVAGFRKDS